MATAVLLEKDISSSGPWLYHLRSQLEILRQSHLPVYQALNQQQHRAEQPFKWRFVAAETLPRQQAYEHFIYTENTIPTRDNLHDLIGGLIWLHYPKTKSLLNHWQYQEIERDGIQAKRSRLRNAITLFDESGIALQAPDSLWNALVNRQWKTVFLDLREQWQHVALITFGHGLLEQLCAHPHLGLTAHVLRIGSNAHLHTGEDIDDMIKQSFMDRVLPAVAQGSKAFIPLPVFGIPGWHSENHLAAFYDDIQVFRPSSKTL